MNAIHDLRSYLDILKKNKQLIRITQKVNLVYELANIAATLERTGGPAPLFEELVEQRKNSFQWPIFSSSIANAERMALALGCQKKEIYEVMKRVQDPEKSIPPYRVTNAKWKENVITGEDIDLRKLPIPTHAIHDGGPYITGGVMVSKDPNSGRSNLSFNRMQIHSKNITGCYISKSRDLQRFFAIAESKGEPLECAVAIGLDPAIMIAAACHSEGSEIEIAGAIRGEPIPVENGITVDVDIPAEAEVVLEGQIIPGERKKEGPLAEFHGYYGEPWDSPVFEVKALCFRNNPIFQTIIPGWREHIYLGCTLGREGLLNAFVEQISKNVNAVHIPPWSNGFTVIVQLSKSEPGESKEVALAALAAHRSFRNCIVVGMDVNIYDPEDILWALTHRVKPGSDDIFVIYGAQNHEMDPMGNKEGIGVKVGIDASLKDTHRYETRVRYETVDLSKYISSGNNLHPPY